MSIKFWKIMAQKHALCTISHKSSKNRFLFSQKLVAVCKKGVFLAKKSSREFDDFLSRTYLYRECTATATVIRLLSYFLEQLRLYFCAIFQLHEYIADGKVEYDLLWLVLHLHHYLNKLLLINIFTLFTFNITSTYSNETLAQDLNFMDIRSIHKITSQMLKKCSLESCKKRYYNERIATFAGFGFPV